MFLLLGTTKVFGLSSLIETEADVSGAAESGRVVLKQTFPSVSGKVLALRSAIYNKVKYSIIQWESHACIVFRVRKITVFGHTTTTTNMCI